MLKPATNKPISSKKIKDIRKQMCYIPHTYPKFYTSLIGNTEIATQHSATDSENMTESNVEADNDNDNVSSRATQLKSIRAYKRKSSATESQPAKRAAVSAIHLINTDSGQPTGNLKKTFNTHSSEETCTLALTLTL